MTLIDTNRWFMIVNPVAGSGKGLEDYPLISKLLRDSKILCEPVFTEHKFHAVELTVSAIKRGFRKVLVVGGDGTVHEVVNGLFIQNVVEPTQVKLGVIAVGTGNDWVRTFGTPRRYQDAIKAIKEEFSFLQDVGEVSYCESHFTQSRYMANVSGVGFDAHVQKTFMHLRKKGKTNSLSYIWSMLKAFFSYKSTGVKIWVDDKLIYNNLMFSAAIGICKFNGGGMQQLPTAIADDGLLDISMIRPIRIWHLLFRFKLLFNGGIHRIGHVSSARGAKIRIESTPEIKIEVDGELLGETPFDFLVHHKAIRVVVSEKFLREHKEQK